MSSQVTAIQARSNKVVRELQNLGMSKYGLIKMATRYLPQVVHDDEEIQAVVSGRSAGSSVVLVSTDKRVIFIDKKPLFSSVDEIAFDMVSGVGYSRAGLSGTLVLHTRIKDYSVRTMNRLTAQRFVDFIEVNCLEKLGSQYA